jgi:hypothetical protein
VRATWFDGEWQGGATYSGAELHSRLEFAFRTGRLNPTKVEIQLSALFVVSGQTSARSYKPKHSIIRIPPSPPVLALNTTSLACICGFRAANAELYLAAIRASGEFEAEIRLRVLSQASLSALSFKHFEGISR